MTVKRRPARKTTAIPKGRPATTRGAPASHADHDHRGPPHGAKRDRHGNPTDFDTYLARLDDPGRSKWQKPDRVIAALGLAGGDVAAEIGSGSGQFTIRMAKVVGEDGRVFAIDVEPRLLDVLAARAAAAEAWGIVGLLAPDGGGLPPEPVDVILMVNVLHHKSAPTTSAPSLAASSRAAAWPSSTSTIGSCPSGRRRTTGWRGPTRSALSRRPGSAW
jgi:SAM-dependent methyltransferase